MLPRSKPLRLWLASLSVVAVMAGCSTLPTAPDLNAPAAGAPIGSHTSSPELLRIGEDGPVTMASASSTKTLSPLLGGVVQAGDFKVIVPPLALTRVAAVTVSQPDLATPVVDLKIGPESANRFRLPVLLVADASRLSPELLSISYISWFNPETGNWERVPGCTISLLNLTITAPLSHFSTYRVERGGKAGW